MHEKRSAILRISITAFIETDETGTAVHALGEDRRLSRSTVEVRPGGIDGAVEYLAAHDPPHLLIVETGLTGDAFFEALDALASTCKPDTRAVVLGADNDIALYKQLIAMGIADYFCGPVTAENLLAQIERLFSEADESALGRVVAFIGVRGGVGSSTIAANTAYALARQFAEDVVLIDLDLAFGTAAIAFNLQQRQSIADALAQPDRLDDVLLERFMLKYDDHLSVVPAPDALGDDIVVDLESLDVLMKLVRQLVPFVVLDLPHQWAPWMQAVLLDANEVVVTACPDLLSLRDAKNVFDVLTPKRGINAPTRFLLNRVGMAKKTELSAGDFEEPVGTRPTASIPFDPVLFGTAVNNGEMVVQVNARSKPARAFDNLAVVVSARTVETKTKKRFIFF